MKTKRTTKELIILVLGLALIVAAIWIFWRRYDTTATLINTTEWDMENISNIVMNYKSDRIYVLSGKSNKIILKEYSSHENSEYFAKTSVEEKTLSIQKGDRPKGAFSSYAEIYVPDDCIDSLNITTTSGKITAQPSDAMSMKTVNFISNSGKISISDIEANTLEVRSQSGAIEMDSIAGAVNVETNSGSIDVINSKFSGSLKSDSSKVAFSAVDFTGNLNVYSKSGKIVGELPQNGSYAFSAKTDSGTVHNYFGEPFTFVVEKKYLAGNYGKNPIYNISLETKSSAIEVD